MPSTSAPKQLNPGQQAKLEESLSYVGRVKARFNHKPGVWDRFQEIPHYFGDYPSHTPEAIERVKKVFCGHPDLIQGFGRFLPPGYCMESEVVEDEAAVDRAVEDQAPENSEAVRKGPLKDAFNYLDQIKLRYKDNPEVKNRFLDNVKDEKSRIIDSSEMIVRVKKLFHGHPDLIPRVPPIPAPWL